MGAYLRLNNNAAPLPSGWAVFWSSQPNDEDFAATAFRRIGTNEIVIAYSGSDSRWPDLLNESPEAALGLYSEQVELAIQFYSDVRAQMAAAGISPAMPVTLTGHSLVCRTTLDERSAMS